jgi:hypothetical protein
MNSHASPCDHMIFVAKSSPERTRVPRRVIDRLTVRSLVNINPGWPRTSSTAAQRKPQHHRLRSPRSESKSFFFLKQAHGIKRAIKEARQGGGAATPARRARGGVAAPACRAREVLSPPPEEVPPPTPTEVKPPSPEEEKQMKPPRRKVRGSLWCPSVLRK